VLVDVARRVAHGGDLLRRVIVGDLDPEFLLEGHDQFDDVQAVGAQVVDEIGVLRHLLGLDAEMLDDDLLHALGSIGHMRSLLTGGWIAFALVNGAGTGKLPPRGDFPSRPASAPRWREPVPAPGA
jgi:hypothetical protein